MVLERTVGRHGRGLVEGHTSEVEGDVLLAVDVVHHLAGLRLEVPPAVPAVGVELEVRRVEHLLAAELIPRVDPFRQAEGVDRGPVVAGVAEVVLVDVDRVREPEVFVGLDQTADDLLGRDLEERHVVVEGQAVQPPPPRLSAAGVHDLNAEPLRYLQQPGRVGGRILDLASLEVLHHEPVVAEDGQGSLVDDRRVVDLLVDMRRMEGRHRGLHHKRVAHPGVVVPGLEGGGDREAHLHPVASGSHRALEEFVLGAHGPARVHLRPGDVRVHVDAARHHRLAGGIDHLRIGTDRVDDATIADRDVHDVAVNPARGVEDRSVPDQDFCHLTPPSWPWPRRGPGGGSRWARSRSVRTSGRRSG